jgi:hypothetical protein
MSTAPKPIAAISREPLFSIGLFTPKMQTLWVVVVLFTIAPELLPIRPMPTPLFLLYYFVKILSFLSLGFLAPLALRSLNGIGLGMVLSFLSAFLIETCQGLLHDGHVFHWHELIGKLTLIALGFAFGLDARYELKMSLGPLKINLLGEQD